MKFNLFSALFILNVLPINTVYAAQPPAPAAAQAEGAQNVQADPFAELMAISEAQKQAFPALPAGMPDLLGVAAHMAKPQSAAKPLTPVSAAVAQEADAVALDDFRANPSDVEGHQAAVDSLKDKKQSAEAASKTSAGGVTNVVAGVLSGAYQAARTGVKYFKDSHGRRLIDKLEQCERDKTEFASGSSGQDTAMIALGVQDSLDKAVYDPKKSENIAKMITGLYITKAKADGESRRNLRKFVTTERNAQLQELDDELNLGIRDLVRRYREGIKLANDKEMLRKLTFEFMDCNSDDDEDLSLVSAEEFRDKLQNAVTRDQNKPFSLHTIVKRDKKLSAGDRKQDKLSAAAEKPALAPAAADPNAK